MTVKILLIRVKCDCYSDVHNQSYVLQRLSKVRFVADEEPEEAAEAPEIDPAVEFEKVRHLLLTEEVLEAVIYLKKICGRLPESPDMTGMSREAKEECFFIFLLKIFGESEGQRPENGGTPEEASVESARTEEPSRNVQLKKCKEELSQQRQLVHYIQVRCR